MYDMSALWNKLDRRRFNYHLHLFMQCVQAKFCQILTYLQKTQQGKPIQSFQRQAGMPAHMPAHAFECLDDVCSETKGARSGTEVGWCVRSLFARPKATGTRC